VFDTVSGKILQATLYS